jgi:hypothetical protein
MTFFEKFVLVVISVLLSVLANRLLAFLDDLRTTKNVIRKARKNMPLFAKSLKNAIITNKSELAEDSYKLLLGCYDLFSKDEQLMNKFEQLSSYYHFLKNGGYDSSEHRKETDIKEIDKIIAKTSD